MFKDALTVAYCTTASPKLAEKYLLKLGLNFSNSRYLSPIKKPLSSFE